MSKNTIHVSTNDAIDHSSQSDNGSNNLPIYLGIDSYSIHIKTMGQQESPFQNNNATPTNNDAEIPEQAGFISFIDQRRMHKK